MQMPRYERCRACSQPLVTRVEMAIGVHIACTASRPAKVVAAPGYGFRRKPEEDDGGRDGDGR